MHLIFLALMKKVLLFSLLKRWAAKAQKGSNYICTTQRSSQPAGSEEGNTKPSTAQEVLHLVNLPRWEGWRSRAGEMHSEGGWEMTGRCLISAKCED